MVSVMVIFDLNQYDMDTELGVSLCRLRHGLGSIFC